MQSGYPCLLFGRNRIAIHKIVWREKTGKKIPKGFSLHHKDWNRMNWEYDNLELLSIEDHRALHKNKEYWGIRKKSGERVVISASAPSTLHPSHKQDGS